MTETNDDPQNTNDADLTALLEACGEGDEEAFSQLVPLVYDHLRRLAHSQLLFKRRNTLDTTGLVHEAYLKLSSQKGARWRDRSHFFSASAQAMRHILVDAARRRLSQKRGAGENPATLPEEIENEQNHAVDVLAVHQALDRLRKVDPQLSRVVECRFFAGLTGEETAVALDVSERTAHRYWLRAKAWLEVTLDADASGTSDDSG